MKRVRWGVVWIICVVGCGQNRFEKELVIESGAVKLAREAETGDYRFITTHELKSMQDQQAPFIIIDAMPADSFEKGHISGARSLPFPVEEMKDWKVEETAGNTNADYAKMLGVSRNQTIVVYSERVACTRSHNAAIWARKLGYADVRRYPGGLHAWKGWKGRGLPLKKGK